MNAITTPQIERRQATVIMREVSRFGTISLGLKGAMGEEYFFAGRDDAEIGEIVDLEFTPSDTLGFYTVRIVR